MKYSVSNNSKKSENKSLKPFLKLLSISKGPYYENSFSQTTITTRFSRSFTPFPGKRDLVIVSVIYRTTELSLTLCFSDTVSAFPDKIILRNAVWVLSFETFT